MPFPTPETVAAYVAETLAAAEFFPLDQAELQATATRLFWNRGDVSQALGDLTDPDMMGPGWGGLLTYGAAMKEAGRPELIADRHVRAAESLEGEIAFVEQTISEKQTRLDAAKSSAKGWLTFDNGPVIDELTSAITGLRASIRHKRSAAVQLRARAAELVAVKAAA